MIFWILTAAIVIAWAWMTIYTLYADWPYGLVVLFLGGLIAGLLWGLIAVGGVGLGLNALVGPNRVDTSTVPLKALASDSSVEGRSYFLGGGYVEGKRVLSFVQTNEDGSFTPGQVDGSDSRVFEDSGSAPVLTIREHVADRWWISPEMSLFKKYEFTVPAESVAEQYSVTP